MFKDLKILITTCGGLTSYDVIKAYKNNGERKVEILGCDPFPQAIGRYFVDKFFTCPNSISEPEEFARFIQDLVKKECIDVVIPCGNEDNLSLAKHKDKIESKILVSEYDDLLKAYDKGAVYEILKEKMPSFAPKFKIIKDLQGFYEAIDLLGYPQKSVVIKPRFGRGGRGVYILDSKLSNPFSNKPTMNMPLEFFTNAIKESSQELIIMEYLQEPFYSVYSLCENGKNIISLNHIREWGSASQTYRGLVAYDESIENLASGVIKAFNLSYTNNMELATSESGNIVLFDLNPRLGASSGVDADIGLNFPYLALKLLLSESIRIDKTKFSKKQRFIRYFNQTWETL